MLTYLLGYDNVRNYDGSWTEWGNSVRVPIETGPGGTSSTDERFAGEAGATSSGGARSALRAPRRGYRVA